MIKDLEAICSGLFGAAALAPLFLAMQFNTASRTPQLIYLLSPVFLCYSMALGWTLAALQMSL
jgi:hypothetical protein